MVSGAGRRPECSRPRADPGSQHTRGDRAVSRGGEGVGAVRDETDESTAPVAVTRVGSVGPRRRGIGPPTGVLPRADRPGRTRRALPAPRPARRCAPARPARTSTSAGEPRSRDGPCRRGRPHVPPAGPAAPSALAPVEDRQRRGVELGGQLGPRVAPDFSESAPRAREPADEQPLSLDPAEEDAAVPRVENPDELQVYPGEVAEFGNVQDRDPLCRPPPSL